MRTGEVERLGVERGREATSAEAASSGAHAAPAGDLAGSRSAAGEAAQLFNALTGILGYASLLKEALGPGDARWRYADAIERSAERAAAVAQALAQRAGAHRPAVAEEAAPARAAVAAGAPGRRRILVVDDHPQVRETVRAILAEEGYEALTARNAAEALAAAGGGAGGCAAPSGAAAGRAADPMPSTASAAGGAVSPRHGGAAGGAVLTAAGTEGAAARTAARSIDLVILDLGLPDRSGAEVLAELRARDPRTRILVSSGYADDAASLRDAGPVGFLPKPYSVDALLSAVRAALPAT